MSEARGSLRSRAASVAFRNRRGQDRHVSSVKATEAKNTFGRVLETALREGAVAITKHDTPKAVLLSWDEFKELAGVRSDHLAALADEFDALLARMQRARDRKAMRAAFDAAPAQLGRAAVAAARRRRG